MNHNTKMITVENKCPWKARITAQALYDFNREFEIFYSADLHKFFEAELGDPSPSGKLFVNLEKATEFVEVALLKMCQDLPVFMVHCQAARRAWRAPLDTVWLSPKTRASFKRQLEECFGHPKAVARIFAGAFSHSHYNALVEAGYETTFLEDVQELFPEMDLYLTD